MSNIYIQEPPTNGKVCLKTTVGDIEIELWSKECPKSCRNFVQLCLENYYNGTIFHRLVPGFIVQGGDPTGTGCGGESIYGNPFKDEFHSRLRFVRRGLVAMANGGKLNDNGSQFFFTLDKTPELQGKNTIFGQVVGNTLYNMLKLAECEVDKNERPENPHKILKTEVISNPFNDIIPRKTDIRVDSVIPVDEDKIKVKGVKNFNLLSFGDEAEENEELYSAINQSLSSKGKSSFDHRAALEQIEQQKVPASEVEKELVDNPVSNKSSDVLAKVQEKLKANREAKSAQKSYLDDDEVDMHKIISDEQKDNEKAKLNAIKDEYRMLKKELSMKKSQTEDKADKGQNANTKPELVDFHSERERYKAKQSVAQKTGGDREKQVMEMLNNFKSKIIKAREESLLETCASTREKSAGNLERTLSDDDDIPESDWIYNTFQPSKEEEQLKEAVDIHTKNEERYSLDDPRNPVNKRRREKKHGKREKDRKRERH